MKAADCMRSIRTTGLHLNSEGYLLWRERIRPILDELARSRTAKATA